MEEAYWKDSQVFRPERHLDADGKLIKSDHVMAFGSGNKSSKSKQ